ncbi:helix-turn-helix domain-containing protein [Nitrosopumilus sp. Nsub]|nr:helix-turn-helix domain-containing protein [Nitrosopumilus sp. Nsub]
MTKTRRLWKDAGVPQSKIYYLLDALEMKGLVEHTQRHPREVKAK